MTNVTSRLDDKQLVESLLFPSYEINDEYRAKRVLTVDGKTLIGLVSDAGDELIILPPDGKKVTISKDDVEELVPNRISSMPAKLVDPLSRDEIADLFAFLREVTP